MESSNLDGQLSSLPGRYARSLFELASAAKKLTKIQEGLDHFHEILETVAHFKTLLLNPVFRLEEQKEVLQEIGKQNKYEPLFLHFLCLLNENRRLQLFDRIYGIFNELVHDLKNTREIRVISATELTKDQQQRVQRLLSSKLEKQLDFSYHVNPPLLGGFLIKVGSYVIDLTVINQVNMLATEMKGNA